MADVRPQQDESLPVSMPVLLSFIAGYVDSYTFLALFGLFAAQVTGSFVIAGAELVAHDNGVVGKLLAIIAFLAAAAVAAALIGVARDAGRAPLPWMLGLEAVLLAAFAAIVLLAPPLHGPTDWHGIIAGLFAAMAMGTQSVLVRLLMKGIPQTNVMTGNMTQLGITLTEIVLAWRRYAHSPHDSSSARKFAAVRSRLWIVLSIALGFLIGTATGAVTYATSGTYGAIIAVVIVAVLAFWALYRERMV